jgi:hypothetical protein
MPRYTDRTDQDITTSPLATVCDAAVATSPPDRPAEGHADGPRHHSRFTTATVGWGLVVGVANAAAPVVIWWLDPSTIHAILIAFIAAVYVGFAVADGRPRVVAVESGVAASFVILAAAAVTVSPWLLVAAYLAHGCKDLWQHRTQFVTGTRWWPPFCATVDWTVAAIIAVAIGSGIAFH